MDQLKAVFNNLTQKYSDSLIKRLTSVGTNGKLESIEGLNFSPFTVEKYLDSHPNYNLYYNSQSNIFGSQCIAVQSNCEWETNFWIEPPDPPYLEEPYSEDEIMNRLYEIVRLGYAHEGLYPKDSHEVAFVYRDKEAKDAGVLICYPIVENNQIGVKADFAERDRDFYELEYEEEGGDEGDGYNSVDDNLIYACEIAADCSDAHWVQAGAAETLLLVDGDQILGAVLPSLFSDLI